MNEIVVGRPALRTAIIGGGLIARRHLEALQQRTNATVSGICDLSIAAGRAAAVRSGAGAVYTDYRKMLEELRPEAIHVLTPAATHLKIARDCLEAGSHVIVEKPATLCADDLQALFAAADRNGRIVTENHNYRFNPDFLALESIVRAGGVGPVTEVEALLSLPLRLGENRYANDTSPHPSHGLPAGAVHEFLTHLCYLTLRFIPEYTGVRAAWRNLGGPPFRYDDLDALIFGTGPAGQIRGRIRFHAYSRPASFRIVVRGQDGVVSTDLFQPCVRHWRNSANPLGPFVNQAREGVALLKAAGTNFWSKLTGPGAYEGLFRYVGDTYQSLLAGVSAPVGRRDMLMAARLLDHLLQQENHI